MSSETIRCALCGQEMPVDTRYCPRCGSVNAHYASPNREADASTLLQTPHDAANSPGAQPLKLGEVQGVRARVLPAPPAATRIGDVANRRGEQEAQGQAAPAVTPDAGDSRHGPVRRPTQTVEPHAQAGYAQSARQQYPRNWAVQQKAVPTQQEAYEAYEAVHGPDQQRVGQPPAGSARSRTGFWLEMFGYVLVLGIGHMYGGRTLRGFGLMLIWWAVMGLVFQVGLQPPLVLIYMLGPLLSALWIKRDIENDEMYARHWANDNVRPVRRKR